MNFSITAIPTTTTTIVTKQFIPPVEDTLSGNQFVGIHRSYIVSVGKVVSYNNEQVWIGKIELPINRMKWHKEEAILK